MKTKLVRMDLTVRVPAEMTAAQARLEVRTLVNEQCNYCLEPGEVRVSKLGPARKVMIGLPLPPKPRPPRPGHVLTLTAKEREIAQALYPKRSPDDPDPEFAFARDVYRQQMDDYKRAVRDGRGYIVPIDGDETNMNPKNLALIP